MKRINRIFCTSVVFSAFMAIVLIPVNGYAQKKTEQQTLASFPDSISGILKNSCVACHSDQSTSKAKIFMNLSEWDKFSSKKKAKKSKSISKKVTNGTMPPEEFLKKRPEAKPTTAQIQRISKWATALKSSR